MSDTHEDPSLDEFDDATRRGLEHVKPRVMTSNPRCPDCWSGPMMHIGHPWGPCQMRDIGAAEACGCTSTRQT